jgi:hypothetical protein
LEHYFERACEIRKYGEHILMPCVIERRTHPELSRYAARLLVPPHIKKGSKLLVPQLVIPDLVVDHCIGNAYASRGFILHSEYLDDQNFYAGPCEDLMNLYRTEGVRFQGIVIRVFKGEKRPKVQIVGGVNSYHEREMFEQNDDMLKELMVTPPEALWWNLFKGVKVNISK